MSDDKDRLYTLSAKFREAILQSNKNMLPETLRNFPSGACGDASLLLGDYLYSLGYSNIDYVCGWRSHQSHAWIEIDGTIIDITADQFPDKNEAVIVTTDKSWHNQFIEDSRESARIGSQDKSIERELNRALAEIIRCFADIIENK